MANKLQSQWASLPADKQDQLRTLLERRQQGQASSTGSQSIPPRADQPQRPVSAAQLRLWFVSAYEGRTATYNEIRALRLTGDLDIAALERSLQSVISRHEALRTIFPVTDGIPSSALLPDASLRLGMVDLTGVESAEEEMQRRAAEAAQIPFDLSRDLLMRAQLYRLAPQDHVLVLIVHDILCDGASVRILYQELGHLYRQQIGEVTEPIPWLPIQYADFAAWQQDQLNGMRLNRSLAFWREHLAGAPPSVNLLTDHPRPPFPSNRGARIVLPIAPELAERLSDLAKRHQATPFIILLAGLNALLYRYTRQDDLVIGSLIANRVRVELEPLIGRFANTLALRTRVADDQTVTQLIADVRNTALAAYDHQELPFEWLVRELNPHRDHRTTMPLFNIMMTYKNQPPKGFRAGDVSAEPYYQIDQGTAVYDLNFEVLNEADHMDCYITYNADLFERDTIRRLAGHYETVLRGMVDAPDSTLSALPLLSEGERSQLVVDWNQTQAPYPDTSTILSLFERHLAAEPDAPAVAFAEQQISYRELAGLAAQMAEALLLEGLAPGDVAAVRMARSIEYVASLLGILKAGGKFVIIEPDHPQQRINYILTDSQAKVLIVKDSAAAELGDPSITVIDWVGLRNVKPEALTYPMVAPDDLAYIAYTSGSTGAPKGILTPHRGVVNYLSFLADTYGIGPGDRILQVAALSFDASIRDTIGPLAMGASVVLVPADTIRSPAKLLEVIDSEGITCILSIVPTLLTALVDEAARLGWRNTTARLVMVSGEKLKASLYHRARTVFGEQALFVNQYGPTETTMIACNYPLRSLPGECTIIPIGRPLHNTQVYVLDRALNPVPVGGLGEIHIGGLGVTRGYLNQPDRTIQSFIPNPFDGGLTRLYKTGDLGYYRPDGTLEILERLDHQVKIRGVRVELEEIETVLAQFPAVAAAATSLIELDHGEPMLAAYVVPKQSAEIDKAAVRKFLRERLPTVMIPAHITVLDSIPLTSSGKVNRSALPAPQDAYSAAQAMAAPTNQIEAELVKIWSSLLGLDHVGVYDDFFALGGHSLLAARVAAAVEEKFGVVLPLASLFQEATIAHLAQIIAQDENSSAWASLVPIQPKGTKPPVYCVHGVAGNVIQFRDLAIQLGEDQPFFGLQAKGLDGVSEPHSRIEDAADHYIEAIRRYQPEGPYYLAGFSWGGLIVYEMAHRLQLLGQQVAFAGMLDTAFHVHSSPELSRPSRLIRLIQVAQGTLRVGLLFYFLRLTQPQKLQFIKQWIQENLKYFLKLPDALRRKAKPDVPHSERVKKAGKTARQNYTLRPYPVYLTYFACQLTTNYRLRVDDPRDKEWASLTLSGAEIIRVKGKHGDFLRPPYVEEFAGTFADALSRARTRSARQSRASE